jgi:hypothetical protein
MCFFAFSHIYRDFDFLGNLNPVTTTEWKPIEIFKSLFLLHHVCRAYRTVNERMRVKEHEIVQKKVDFDSSNYQYKLKNDRIEDDSDQAKFLDKLIPLLLMDEVTFFKDDFYSLL